MRSSLRSNLVSIAAAMALLGAIAGLAVFTSLAHAATPWYVDASAAPGGDGTSALTATTTIQAAVNAAAAGDTINVAAGTYAEHVSVNKSVTLVGANAGVAATSTRSAESVVDGTDTGTPFAVTANDVTINGFTVKNGSNGGLDAGIWSQSGTQNSSIINNIITNNDFGVWAQCGGNCLIQANLFDGNNKPGAGSGSASISADSTAGLTINNNEFKNDTAGNPILLQGTGAGAHTNVVVSNNSFHNNTNSNVYALDITGGAFSGNTIATDAAATGLSLSGTNADVTVTGNTITGGLRGVRIENTYGVNTNITVNRNNVSGNTEYGVGNSAGQVADVDATCNWWGASNGPSTVGPGSGSPVTSGVTYQSWLTTSDLAGACNGPLDTTAPIISGVAVATTSTTATVTWNTDEAADGQVSYGLTSSYTASSTLNTATTTSHTATLTGLSPATTYHYQVSSSDAAGNQATTSDATFTTDAAALLAPAISNITVSNVSSTTATVNWDTDLPASSQVAYGTTSSYGSQSPYNGTASTTHAVTLTNLSEGTVYHFAVSSGNITATSTSSDSIFVTQSTASSTPLALDGSPTPVSASATANGTFASGWKWILRFTVPDNEDAFRMAFSDWTGSAGTFPADNNVRISSPQSSNASTTDAGIISPDNNYGGWMYLNSDVATSTPGRQIDVTVEVRIPIGTPAGSYSTTYTANSVPQTATSTAI